MNEKPKALRIQSIANRPVWHRCLPKDGCGSCSASTDWTAAWDAFNLCACICLQERPDRLLTSMAEFHRVGLCSSMQYYRAIRPNPETVRKLGFQRTAAFGSWTSHCDVAIHALQTNAFLKTSTKLGCIFVCEDDVQFIQSFGPKRLRRIIKQIESLGDDFDIYYLGWVSVPMPGSSYPVAWNDLSLWRTEALTLHAYVLSERGAKCLASNPYHAYRSKLLPWFIPQKTIPKEEHFLDDFTRQRLVGYCSLPSVAVQSDSHSDQPVRGKELGLALHNRIIQHAPMCLETITMIIPFLTLLVLVFLFLYIVFQIAKLMDRFGERSILV